MSNTTTTHQRFWRTMIERYGARWVENYGQIPVKAWTEMLDRYTPKQIGKAITALATESPLHPPTQPQFAKLLAKVGKPEDDGIDYRRGYWRSMIVGWMEAELIPHTCSTSAAVEMFLAQRRATLGTDLRNLLNELCDMETANGGQRTQGLEFKCRDTVRAALKPYVLA